MKGPVEYCLSYPDTPPSFNKVGHTGNRWTWTREKKRWQEFIEMMLLIDKVPRGLVHVDARAELLFPTKRKRDEGNYRVLLEKCLGDALVNGEWLIDDTSQFYRFGAVRFDHGAARTKLILVAHLSS